MRLLILAALLLVGCAQPAPQVAAPANAPPQGAEMEAAIQEARDHFPEFRTRFEAGAKGEVFYVKVPFNANAHTIEELWVKVTKIEATQIQGLVESEPVEMKLKPGEPVTVDVSAIEDWNVVNAEGKMVAGGYTVKVLKDSAVSP